MQIIHTLLPDLSLAVSIEISTAVQAHKLTSEYLQSTVRSYSGSVPIDFHRNVHDLIPKSFSHRLMEVSPPAPLMHFWVLSAHIMSKCCCLGLTGDISQPKPSYAQCYPRHACALCGAVLMQLRDQLRSTPTLVPTAKAEQGIIMRNHARYACMTVNCFQRMRWFGPYI